MDRAARGFLANFSQGCGARLIASSEPQIIETPTDFAYSECDWLILARNPGATISSQVANSTWAFLSSI